jgi:hypothetical protein
VVVGSHGQGRIKGIVLGSTATELVHKAPCPVLVARTAGGWRRCRQGAGGEDRRPRVRGPARLAGAGTRLRCGRRRSHRRRQPRPARAQGARLGQRTGRTPSPLLDTGRARFAG